MFFSIACISYAISLDKIQNVINERDAIIAYKERMNKTHHQTNNLNSSQHYPNMTNADENVHHMLEMVLLPFLPPSP